MIEPRERCAWAGADGPNPDPLMVAYHDDEWGAPVHDDTELFERLALESFQAGLSWSTILRKREGFRAAFRGFDPSVVATFDAADRDRLMADAGIVRNGAKVDATIGNAAALLATAADFGSFDTYLAELIPPPPLRLPPTARAGDIPSTTAASDGLSRDLKKRGFRFVGSTIVYAFMQSVGLVDDHLPGCFGTARRRDTLAVTSGLHSPGMKTEFALDCPWCSGPMTVVADGSAGDPTVACATCSIVVELAPDPVADLVALAA